MPSRTGLSRPSRFRSGNGNVTKGTRASLNNPAISAPDEGADSRLRSQICTIFAEIQRSTVQHRKQIIILRRLHETCCYQVANDNHPEQGFSRDEFNHEMGRCLIRVLTIRKAEGVGDRVVRFLGAYLKSSSQKDLELLQASDSSMETLEMPTSSLASHILGTLLPFLDVKDKTVRFRSAQIISHIINCMDTLDDQLFYTLRNALLGRLHDKEAPVRLQAVYGLGRLAAETEEEDENQSDSGSEEELRGGVLGKLLNVLQHDPSAEVRRNLLLNLPITKDVLPFLLERARDEDATTRRALYSRLLPALGDFRHLSLTHREKLLRWGLRDRDEAVRKATAKLFRERWIEDCAALPTVEKASSKEDNDIQNLQDGANAAAPSLDALLELLERIDVVNSGGEGGIALIAMQEFWEGRPDYVDYVSFPDHFWSELSPELAFVARTYNDFCRQSKQVRLHDILEERLPEVTKFAFLLQKELKRLIELLNAEAVDLELEEESAQCEFVVEQMLNLALTLDYGDEVGRQKMFALMREALATPDLPEETTRLVVETLRLVCGEDSKGEKAFCGVVLEAIAEVHDAIMGDENVDPTSSSIEESFHSATSQVGRYGGSSKVEARKLQKHSIDTVVDNNSKEDQAIREIVINMKCLHIALCMLQNVQGDLEENIHLVTMLNNLIVPAVRSQESPIRERGLCCLGLCCLLGKTLAGENLTLFLHCFNKGNSSLQATALQIISDVITTHPSLLAVTDAREDDVLVANSVQKQVLKAFGKAIRAGESSVQSMGAVALAKTMLGRIIIDQDLLKQLVITYFDPETIDNIQLRQALAYFLPVYCQSNIDNARRVADMAPSIITRLATLRDAYLDDAEAESDNETTPSSVINLATVAQMLVDWTDPRKSLAIINACEATESPNAANSIHFVLAEGILEHLVAGQVSKVVKKLLISLLGKLYLPLSGCEQQRLRGLLKYVADVIDSKLTPDVTSRNILAKLQTQLLKGVRDSTNLERGEELTYEMINRTTDQLGPQQLSPSASKGFKDSRFSDVSADTTDTIVMPDAEGTRMISVDEHNTTFGKENDVTGMST